MDTLQQTYRIKLDLIPIDYVRSFHDDVNWKNRLIGILGQKGVGKSTMLLQHIKLYDKVEESLYVQADDFYFAGHRIYDLALEFFQQGGKRLYIDEIHKYKGWTTEIKMIYDQLPLLQVVYSGSSILDLKRGGKADLSRRTIEYTMPVLSFREYLNISQGWNLKPSSLEDILVGKVDFPYGNHRPLKYYQEYLQYGCYPYFTEEDFPIKLRQSIIATVEDDIPRYAEMTVSAAVKLKKLMYMIAQSVPYKPNYSTLARDLDISRNTLPDYIDYLEKSGLFNALRENIAGDGLLQKVEKLFLDNSNIIHALGLDKADEGTIRETMFLTWMKRKYSVYSSKISDFEIKDMTFEVGGRKKKGKQLKDADKGYIVKDNIEYAAGKNIPIWMFGFIY
ncbi:MAG: AAA family ATPase [Bacteroidales bacterium]|nr:ATP-binding protein [Bacteroidales bacterium]MBQ8644746.1 AAA family ATPase [Bacteroidales bacterium]MBR4088163.1 AAA family ATPase [Bacteroidales bacterium]